MTASRRLAPAVLAALALGACGRQTPSAHDSADATIVVPGPNGASVTVGDATPANLPPFVKVFPGARITASKTSPAGGLLALETSASPDAVLGFYRKSAGQAGLSMQLDSAALGWPQSARVVVFGADNPRRSLTATVRSDDGQTKVALLYGQP